MATRIAQQNLLVGAEASSAVFTPAGESQALTCTVTELVADSVVQMVVVDDQGLVKASARIFGTGAKKVVVGKLDGTLRVDVMQLQGSGQVIVTDPDGGAVETTDLEDLSVTTAKIALLAVDTGQIAAGALAASAAGRAKIADDLFTAAEFAAGAGGKFAADCISAATLDVFIADDALTAANVAAKFATDSVTAAILLDIIGADQFDAAACANAFAAGAIPVAKVASAPLSLESVTADPGTGVALPANLTTSIAITTAGAETNTLAVPSAVGKVLSLTLDVRVGGDRVITVAAPINQAGDTTITMDTAGDNIVLVGVQVAGAPVWRVLQNDGCTLT